MTAESMDGITRGLEKLDFHHPYTPYDVQEQFMKTVFDVLEAGDGHVGILESPTGTVSFCFCRGLAWEPDDVLHSGSLLRLVGVQVGLDRLFWLSQPTVL